MTASRPHHNAAPAVPGARRLGRRLLPAALLGATALGTIALAGTFPALAQRAATPAVQEQLGRAPFSFADIIERVKPSVVSIHVAAGGAPKVASKGGKGGRDSFPELPDDHPLNELFKNLPKEFGGGQQAPRRSAAQGSGFVISADGYVVTNHHVVSGATKIQVSFDEQTKLDAELIGTDARTDIALLKISNSKGALPYVKFSTKPVRVGDWVLAVGNPFGLGGTVTAGIVSALSRDIGNGPYDFLQIDAAVNRGNSGGPTFNLEGEVVGVNTAIYSPSGGNVGIAFAVPAKTAGDVIEQLRVSKSVSRGWLGVKITSVDEDMATSLGLSEPRGALISEITAGGPAAGSTLRSGDVVMSVNGSKVDNSRDLARKIAEYAPATSVTLDVMRYGKKEAVSVKLGTFPNEPQVAAAPAAAQPGTTELSQLGITLSPASGTRGAAAEGVLVKDVDGSSDAAGKGLKAGDLILEVQGKTVSSPTEVAEALKQAETGAPKAVFLKVKQGDNVRFMAVRLKAS